MSAESKITAAKVTIALEHCFWGSLMGSLDFKSDPTCPTAWVDGRTLGYNPTFIESLTHDQVVALIAHEISHCALGHPYRRNGREMKRWNVSCDKAINGDLRETFTLPPDALYPEGDEAGKSAEWIHSRMGDKQGDNPQPPQPQPPQPDEDEDEESEQPQPGGDDEGDEDGEPGEDGDGNEPGEDGQPGGDSEGEGDGDGNEPGDGTGKGTGNPQPGKGDQLGECRDAPTGPDVDGNEPPSEDEWKQLASESMNNAKLRGDMPGGMARAVEKALEPKIDVRSLLLRFFQDLTNADYTWTRPSPRYLPMGLYLPKLHSEALGEVAILVDTSGSVDAVALQTARGIIESVIAETSPAGITLYFVDTEVHGTHRMERGEHLTWEPKGGGGTSFASFFETVAKGDIEPVCIIGISDLCAHFGNTVPATPVLWLTDTQGATAPFGEVVYIED